MGKRIEHIEQPDSWPNRRAAADELSILLGEDISVNTMAGWMRQPGCPLPAGGGAIPREALIEWAQARREPGRPPTVTDAEALLKMANLRVEYLEEQIRNLKGKNARIYAESIDAAEARTGVLRAIEQLKAVLLREVPSHAWDASQGKTLDEALPVIKTRIVAALNECAAQAIKA